MKLIEYAKFKDAEYFRFNIREDHNIIVKKFNNRISPLDEFPDIYSFYKMGEVTRRTTYFFLGERREKEFREHFEQNETRYKLRGSFLPQCSDIFHFFEQYYQVAHNFEENRKKLGGRIGKTIY